MGRMQFKFHAPPTQWTGAQCRLCPPTPAAPLLMPTSTPSSVARRLAIAMASSLLTCATDSRGCHVARKFRSLLFGKPN